MFGYRGFSEVSVGLIEVRQIDFNPSGWIITIKCQGKLIRIEKLFN